jgi:hypothetical protein
MRDFARAAGFRRLAEEIRVTPAALAPGYALSLDIDTLVLGVKNQQELAECVAAAEAGPLPAELMARIDEAVPDQPALSVRKQASLHTLDKRGRPTPPAARTSLGLSALQRLRHLDVDSGEIGVGKPPSNV